MSLDVAERHKWRDLRCPRPDRAAGAAPSIKVPGHPSGFECTWCNLTDSHPTCLSKRSRCLPMDPESMEAGESTGYNSHRYHGICCHRHPKGEPGKYPQGPCVLGETYMRCDNVRVRRNIIFVHFERHSYMKTSAC